MRLLYLVGMAEQSSAILMAIHWIKAIAISHPQTIPAVPAYPIPAVHSDLDYQEMGFLKCPFINRRPLPELENGTRTNIPYHNVLANDGKSPRTEKLTQKVVQRENSRLNSCIYPRETMTRSSTSISWSVMGTSPSGSTEVACALSTWENRCVLPSGMVTVKIGIGFYKIFYSRHIMRLYALVLEEVGMEMKRCRYADICRYAKNCEPP